MPSINELSTLSEVNQSTIILGQDVSSLTTGKITVGQLADVFISIAVSGAVTPAAISAAGGVLDNMYSDALGYAKRVGVQSYTAVSTIPATDISGLSLDSLSDVSVGVPTTNQVLGYDGSHWIPTSVAVNIDASAVEAAGALMTSEFSGVSGYMRKLTTSTYDVTAAISAAHITGLGTLAITSTAASARSFLEFTSIGTAIVIDSSTAASVRTVLNLGTLATTSTAVSGRTFLGITTFGATLVSTASATSARTILGFSTLGAQIVSAGTAASVQSILGYSTVSSLDSLTNVSVPSPATNQVLSFNGTEWIGVSVAGAGAIVVSGSPTNNQYLRYDGTNWSGVSVSPLVATSTVASAQSYLNLGTLATVSTAASGISFLGLGTLATTSTAASARSFIEFTSIGTAITVNASTAASVRSVLGVPSNTLQDSIGGFIPTVNNQNYYVILNSAVTITVSSLIARCSSGSATATFKINGVNIGATANAVTSAESSNAATSANVVVPGDDLIMTISSNSSCKNMAFNVHYSRTLS
jgi:hypothetical protein